MNPDRSADLTAALAAVAAAAPELRDEWWVFGSAAMTLAGVAGLDPPDVDLLVSERDARRLVSLWNADDAASSGAGRFRSTVFATARGAGLPIEIMAGLEVRTADGWTPVVPRSRVGVDLGRIAAAAGRSSFPRPPSRPRSAGCSAAPRTSPGSRHWPILATLSRHHGRPATAPISARGRDPHEEEQPMSRYVQVTFDAHDPRALSSFWRDVLGYVHPAPPGVDLPEGADPLAAWDEFLARMGVPEEERNTSSAVEDPDGPGPRLFFQQVPEDKVTKNRVHLDVRAAPGLRGDERMAALEAECERLVALGATRLRRDEPAPPMSEGYIVMTDPEGNEFCLD